MGDKYALATRIVLDGIAAVAACGSRRHKCTTATAATAAGTTTSAGILDWATVENRSSAAWDKAKQRK